MKIAVLALIGAVNAKTLHTLKDKINALRIEVNPNGGQAAIENAGNQVKATWESV